MRGIEGEMLALILMLFLCLLPLSSSSAATSPPVLKSGGVAANGALHGLREGVQKAVGKIAHCVGIVDEVPKDCPAASPPNAAPVPAEASPDINLPKSPKKKHKDNVSGFWLPNDRSRVMGEAWWPDCLDEKGKVLGVGRFSEVYSSRMANGGQDVAVKVIKVKPTEIVLHKRIDREIAILEEVGDNRHIVKLLQVFRADDRVVLVFERCYGGELFGILEDVEVTSGGDRVFLNMTKGAEHPKVPFGEEQIVKVMRQVIEVVSYLHDRGVVHRDLKLENVLLDKPYATVAEGATDCKLIDFGLSKRVSEGEFFSSCGSAYYAAPEIMTAQRNGKGGYGKECDLWAIGVMSYGLLCKQYPFDGPQIKDVLAASAKGTYSYPDKVRVSDDAKEFISRCLEPDPNKRITAGEALKHRWITTKGKQARG